jgi:hypothetical protein
MNLRSAHQIAAAILVEANRAKMMKLSCCASSCCTIRSIVAISERHRIDPEHP